MSFCKQQIFCLMFLLHNSHSQGCAKTVMRPQCCALTSPSCADTSVSPDRSAVMQNSCNSVLNDLQSWLKGFHDSLDAVQVAEEGGVRQGASLPAEHQGGAGQAACRAAGCQRSRHGPSRCISCPTLTCNMTHMVAAEVCSTFVGLCT